MIISDVNSGYHVYAAMCCDVLQVGFMHSCQAVASARAEQILLNVTGNLSQLRMLCRSLKKQTRQTAML